MAFIQVQSYNRVIAITKSDTVNYDGGVTGGGNAKNPADAIYVGGAGVVVAVFEDGTTFSATCIAGQVLPFKTIRVNSTNTTATLMGACYTV